MVIKGFEVNDKMVSNYISSLVNRFYKILPIKESNEPTLNQYIESLLREMLGFKSLIERFNCDDRYMTLLAILQSMIDNNPDVAAVKADVFRAINILKKLESKYCTEKR